MKPTLLTPAKHKAIVKAIREGNRPASAARLVKVHHSTLFRWLREGEADPESPYRKLWEDCEQALAEWEAEMVELVVDAARSRKPGTWTAGMTLLERRMPEHYGRRDAVAVEGRVDHIFVPEFSPEQTKVLLDKLSELGSKAPVGAPADLELEEGEGFEE